MYVKYLVLKLNSSVFIIVAIALKNFHSINFRYENLGVLNHFSIYPYQYLWNESSWSPETGYKEGHNDLLFRAPGGSYANKASFILDCGGDDVQEECMPRSNGYYVRYITHLYRLLFPLV